MASVRNRTAQGQGAHSTTSRTCARGRRSRASINTDLGTSCAAKNIEILELPEIEARTFLQFRQWHLIDGKAARIEWRSWRRGSWLRRHHVGLPQGDFRQWEELLRIGRLRCNRNNPPSRAYWPMGVRFICNDVTSQSAANLRNTRMIAISLYRTGRKPVPILFASLLIVTSATLMNAQDRSSKAEDAGIFTEAWLVKFRLSATKKLRRPSCSRSGPN